MVNSIDKGGLLTIDEAVEDLRERVEATGSQSEFAAWLGVSRQYLSDVLRRQKPPLRIMGYERVVLYRRTTD
jgi:hypothetical protein